jgi:hypothetical protein
MPSRLGAGGGGAAEPAAGGAGGLATDPFLFRNPNPPFFSFAGGATLDEAPGGAPGGGPTGGGTAPGGGPTGGGTAPGGGSPGGGTAGGGITEVAGDRVGGLVVPEVEGPRNPKSEPSSSLDICAGTSTWRRHRPRGHGRSRAELQQRLARRDQRARNFRVGTKVGAASLGPGFRARGWDRTCQCLARQASMDPVVGRLRGKKRATHWAESPAPGLCRRASLSPRSRI